MPRPRYLRPLLSTALVHLTLLIKYTHVKSSVLLAKQYSCTYHGLSRAVNSLQLTINN